MRKRLSLASAALAGALAATGLGVAVATPAAAATSCPWPYVCFYDGNGSILTMYQDMGWQNTGSLTQSASGVYDARNNDCAYLEYSDGYIDQIHPGQWLSLGSPVVAIDITSGCP